MNDGLRFRIFASSLGGVHLILAGIGAALMCQPLLAANLIVCLLDLLSIFGTRNGRNYFTWISIVYFASCFQSLYACVLLGWRYGFSLYQMCRKTPCFSYGECQQRSVKKNIVVNNGSVRRIIPCTFSNLSKYKGLGKCKVFVSYIL